MSVTNGTGDLQAQLLELQAARDALRRRVEQLEDLCQAAQAGMARYHELFEFAPDGYLTTDLAGNILEVNHAATLRFGRPRAFLTGKPLPFLVVPEEYAGFYARLARLARRPEPVSNWEVRLQGPKGHCWEGSLTVTVVVDAEGRPAGLRWLLRDVTPRKQAEDQLRAEKALVESLVDTAEAAVLLAGPEREVLRVNAYLLTLSGYRREELLGRDWSTLLLPEAEQAAARAEFWAVLNGEEGHRAVRPLRTRDGRRRLLAWSITRLPGGTRGFAPVLLVGHDVTELHEAQQRALRLERLAAIGQMAAGLAHESRNALQRGTACLERLKWALQGQPHALDLVERARQAQDDLLRLYDDVREYAAAIKLDCRPCDVTEVWREAWAQLLAVNPGRAARLEEVVEIGDWSCAADRFRLLQVFRNLLDNALAAAPDPARVLVRCADAVVDGRPALRVAVRDNGPGLTAEQREHLFEPFYTTKTRGTGLGLAIARRIVEAHGGQITVPDAPPPGAEIVLTLPRSQP